MDRFSNAINAIDAARSTLLTFGDARAAAALQGIEVYSVESARVALNTIRCLKPCSMEGGFALLDATQALEVATYQRPMTYLAAVA